MDKLIPTCLVIFFLCKVCADYTYCDKYYGGNSKTFWTTHYFPITNALEMALVIEECKHELHNIGIISFDNKKIFEDNIISLLVGRYVCYNEKPWFRFMNDLEDYYKDDPRLCEEELLSEYEKLIEKMLEFEDKKYTSNSFISNDKIIWLQKEYTSTPYKLKLWNMSIQRLLKRHNNSPDFIYV